MTNKFANIKDRVLQLAEFLGVGKKKFCEQIGMTYSNFTGKAKETPLNSTAIGNILSIVPNINIEWLITGIGDIMRTDADVQEQVAAAEPTAVGGIPLIPIEAMAGVLSGNSTQVMERECEHYNIPMFKGAEFLIRISGDSMQPKYYSGDIVACKRLPLDTFFQWNRVYVVDSEQGVIIKRVRRGSDDRHIVFVSDNTAYEPFELPLEKIYSIALVVGVVRAE